MTCTDPHQYLFNYDDSFLCGLVSDDVERVVTANDAILHLSVKARVGIVSLDASNGTTYLGRLHGGDPEGI